MEIPVHPKCNKCKSDLEKLKEFMENRPWKYGSRAVVHIKQDFLGDGWHFEIDRFDNYEAESLRKEYEESENKDYDLQGLLNNLAWGGVYYDE